MSLSVFTGSVHRSEVICDFLKTLDLNQDKMVIFVPLKADRYLHDKKMELVRERVHTAYESFFNSISANSRCTVVIAPIFTFGTVEFTRFRRIGSKIMLDEEFKDPKYPLYKFTSKAGNLPEPWYCEQPLLYVLLFLFKVSEESRHKEYNGGLFPWLGAMIGEVFLKMPSSEDFRKEADNIRKQLKTSGVGYEIVFDPYKLKGI